MKRLLIITILVSSFFTGAKANYLFITMDDSQVNHLKAYGLVFWTLKQEVSVDWLLNYQGGSFMI